MLKILVGLAVSAVSAFAFSAPILYENFNIKPKWKAFAFADLASPSKPFTNAINNRLEINIPYNTTGSNFGAGYVTTCLFSGDFDVYVDYALPLFPFRNGTRVGMATNKAVQNQKWNQGAILTRISAGVLDGIYGENYISVVGNGGWKYIPTTARSGRLRLVRSGNYITSYYYDASVSTWVAINYGGSYIPSTDTPIELAAWSHDSLFSDQNIKVVFDNFLIGKGTLVGAECPTPWVTY